MDHPSIILGIDVASQKLDLGLWENDTLTHEQIQYQTRELDSYLRAHACVTPAQCVVGVESTGDYHYAVARYFLERGFEVRVLNPILTKQYTRTTIRGTKTDKKDSELICHLIRQGHGNVAQLASFFDSQKELLRLSRMLTKVATQLKLRLQSTERKALPGTRVIARKAERVITTLGNITDEIMQQVALDRSEAERLIDSIPGFSVKLAAIVHHELGNVRRFDNAKRLVAYAGLDPRIKQSGHTLNTTGHITKRGSTYLRYALYLAANIARLHDPELRMYYVKKKTEGRSHKETLCIIARKLLHRIYAVLKAGRPYEIRNSGMLSTA